jgi:hypothetical protein
MPYSKFTLPEVVAQFGLSVDYETNLFPQVTETVPGELLKSLLADYVPLGLAIGTEKARSEFIIAPVLAEVRQQTEKRVSLFSGIDFHVDPEQGLAGYCDFLISLSRDPYFVQAPVLAIIEAKNEDIKSEFGQCVAAMVAARLFNERKGQSLPAIYGAVTTGEVWRFLKLENGRVYVDREERFLKPVERLLGILLSIVRGDSEETADTT